MVWRVSCCGILALLGCGAAGAQVARPTPEEAQISPLDIPGGGGFRSSGLSAEPGLADARDFTGTWDQQGRADALSNFRAVQSRATAGSAASATGEGVADLARLRAGQAAKLSCMPAAGPTSGGDGPVEIIQTADHLTWMAEEMHAIRRIYLRGDFTASLPRSYNGESIGHFDGDVLVVETRGMKGLPDEVRMLERLQKSSAGRVLEDQIRFVNADGTSAGPGRTLTLYYRPNEKMLEWICEDYGQIYQPGGYDRKL
jgi:hypothetical protein